MMEETFLSRFDSLDVRVRKVLQTCAVLGLSFGMSDVIQVHPEMDEGDIEHALDVAVDEMVLVEQVEDEEDEFTLNSGSGTRESDSATPFQTVLTRSSDGVKTLEERFFQFSNAMWRKNVLTTMLKERKIELHRLIAEAMERDQVLILEESDISRLLTLFDHWKSCGSFQKTAPLALAVGARLEEWDLCAQSLELYEDALEMSFESVQTSDDGSENDEWVQVAAKPIVLDLILRLHIRVGMCQQRLGEDHESIATFEDALSIISSASKIHGMSRSLMMPIISSLCVLRLEIDANDSKARAAQMELLEQFIREARVTRNPVHVGRAISLQAMHHARCGRLREALETLDDLWNAYDIAENSFEMIAEYGRDFCLEAFAESVQWHYLLERHDVAERQADMIIDKYVPLVDPTDGESMMYVILPVVQVLKLLNRATDADWLLKRYVIDPSYDQVAHSLFWVPLFNPLAYLLDVIMMEENESGDLKTLAEMEGWVLDEDNAIFDVDIERKAHTLMGELCWRLANFKDDDDPSATVLLEKARELLVPVARHRHGELFLKHTAQALIDAM